MATKMSYFQLLEHNGNKKYLKKDKRRSDPGDFLL